MRKKIMILSVVMIILVQFIYPIKIVKSITKENLFSIKEDSDNPNNIEVFLNRVLDYDYIEILLPPNSKHDSKLLLESIKDKEEKFYEFDEKNNLIVIKRKEELNKFLLHINNVDYHHNILKLKAIKNNVTIESLDYEIKDSLELKQQEANSQDTADLSKPEIRKLNDLDIKNIDTNDSLNTSLSLQPIKEEIESGTTSIYKLSLKTTGSQKKYEKSTLEVTLPINDYTFFNQDLNELIIDGVKPIFNNDEKKLIYYFSTLKPGSLYERNIKIETKNGYTPDGTELKLIADLKLTDEPDIHKETKIVIKATSEIVITKKFNGQVWLNNQWKKSIPKPGLFNQWEILITIPKKSSGQSFIKEDSMIEVTDTLEKGLVYSYSEPKEDQVKQKKDVSWSFKAPSYSEQDEAKTDLFKQKIIVVTQINQNVGNSYVTSNVSVNNIDISNNINTAVTTGKAYVYADVDGGVESKGSYLVPGHYGPADSIGGIGSESPNAVITVGEDAFLRYSVGVSALYEGQFQDFENLSYEYFIDKKLFFKGVRTPGYWKYWPYWGYYPNVRDLTIDDFEELDKKVTFDIYGIINGTKRLLKKNADSMHYYSRESLGINESDNVSSIEYRYTQAPKGIYSGTNGWYDFEVVKGSKEKATNYVNIYGSVRNRKFLYDSLKGGNNIPEWLRPKTINIVDNSVSEPPISTIGIKLMNHNGGQINLGENRIEIEMSNIHSSTSSMEKKLESIGLLPLGVYINDKNPMFSNNNGGKYEVIDNFRNTGRQAIKVIWNENYLRANQSLKFSVGVDIKEINVNVLKFDVYGFSGNKKIDTPKNNNSLTGSISERDLDDLNGNGKTDEMRLKSQNEYILPGTYDIQTEKYVKGPQDNEWKKFTKTYLGGTIDYKLFLTNTTGKNISHMTLIDVLPSVGDIGITDNVARGSTFTPKLSGPITLPTDWKNKVEVFYSTEKNPDRNDLIEKISYPEGVKKLGNPSTSQKPIWLKEEQVPNWETIYSFKIELKNDTNWIKGTDISILFNMRAPNINEIDNDQILDVTVPPIERAAWNSFAVTTDYSQPIEPYRAGIYIEDALGIFTVKKIDSTTKQGLAGAKFEVTSEDKLINKTITTDSSGIARLEKLPYGKYNLKEIKAPEGYVLLGNSLSFEVSTDQYQINKIVENEKQGWILPETGGIGTVIFYIIGGSIMFGSIVLLTTSKHRKQQ